MLEGPLREFLKRYFDLEEFGSNNREESLYYLILFFGLFQIIIFLQAFFQPVIEIKNGKIALKTKEKILSVINAVDEITDIEERGDFMKERIITSSSLSSAFNYMTCS